MRILRPRRELRRERRVLGCHRDGNFDVSDAFEIHRCGGRYLGAQAEVHAGASSGAGAAAGQLGNFAEGEFPV